MFRFLRGRTPASSETTPPTVEVEDTAQLITVNDRDQATATRVGKDRQDPHDVRQAITLVNPQLLQD